MEALPSPLLLTAFRLKSLLVVLFPRLFARWLTGALLVFTSTLSRPSHATAELVSPPPPELEAFEEALTKLAEAAQARAWPVAIDAVRASASAWARFRDGKAADPVSPLLIWRLDALEAYLRHAAVAKNSRRLAEGANLGRRLTLAIRGYFRAEGAVDLTQLRIELRELSIAAGGANFQRAERALKRALFLWERLRAPAERRARVGNTRMRSLGAYFDICFDELANASNERDIIRIRRAARSALELTETMMLLLE